MHVDQCITNVLRSLHDTEHKTCSGVQDSLTVNTSHQHKTVFLLGFSSYYFILFVSLDRIEKKMAKSIMTQLNLRTLLQEMLFGCLNGQLSH